MQVLVNLNVFMIQYNMELEEEQELLYTLDLGLYTFHMVNNPLFIHIRLVVYRIEK